MFNITEVSSIFKRAMYKKTHILNFEDVIHFLQVKHKRPSDQIGIILSALIPAITDENLVVNEFFIRSVSQGSLIGISRRDLGKLMEMIRRNINDSDITTSFISFESIIGNTVVVREHVGKAYEPAINNNERDVVNTYQSKN